MAPLPKLTSPPSELGTAAPEDTTTEPKNYNHFTLTLKKGALHCKAVSQPS